MIRSIIVSLLFAISLSATVINVPDDQTTIQAGIDAAVNGDTVLVQPGTYVENINFNGKNIALGSLLLIAGDTTYISQTIIDANGTGRVVTFENGEDSSAVLAGFTITGGQLSSQDWPEGVGGGILCYQSNPTLYLLNVNSNMANYGGGIAFYEIAGAQHANDLEISNNVAIGGGGGVLIYEVNEDIDLGRILVSGNSAQTGAGIYHSAYNTNNRLLLLRDIIVEGNTAENGGGFYSNYGQLLIENAVFSKNTAENYGAIAAPSERPLILNHVTIVDNVSINNTGALNVGYHSTVFMVNSIIWGNSLPQISVEDDADQIFISHSNVPMGPENYSISQYSEFVWGEENIYSAPLFTDPVNGNYTLSEFSQCIGAGSDSLNYWGTDIVSPAMDIINTVRPFPVGSNPDIGAYEHLSGNSQPYESLTITEIMQNPSTVSDEVGEWFELFNYGTMPIDILGWEIVDAGSDIDTIRQSLVILPLEYTVLGKNLDLNSNGGVEIQYAYSNFTLGNSSDEIILIDANGIVIDSVAWDGGPNFPDPNGASMALIDPTLDNSIGSNWTEASTPFGMGDFGTPGLPNFLSNIVINPETLDFDTVFVDESGELTLNISNDGNAPLLIDSVYTNSPLFGVSFTDSLIETTAVLQITFTPTDFGDVSEVLYILSNDPDEGLVEIPLSGFGYFLSPDIELERTSIDFGGVMDGLTGLEVFQIYNIGEGVLNLDSIYCTENFSVSETNGSVVPGDSLSLEVSFSPDDEIAFSGALIIVTGNDPDEDTLSVSLSGVGTAPAPNLVLDLAEVDFGKIARGEVDSIVIVITNTGMQTLEMDEVRFPIPNNSPFWTDFEDASLEMGDTTAIVVYCLVSEVHENVESSILTIFSNDPDEGEYVVNVHCESYNLIRIPADFQTIQEGINVALTGDSLVVAPGIYNECLHFEGQNFILTSYLCYYPDSLSLIESTIVQADDCYALYIENQPPGDITVQGLTIRGSTYGGIAAWNNNANILFTNIVVSDNVCAFGTGGGFSINSNQGTITISSSIVENNQAPEGGGGGVSAWNNDSLFVLNSIIKGNSAAEYGGGLDVHNSNVWIEDCRIESNSSQFIGAGGFYYESFGEARSIMMNHVLIVNNIMASGDGGAAMWLGGGQSDTVELDHVTISQNIGGDLAAVSFSMYELSEVSILNSVIWNNNTGQSISNFGSAIDITYSLIEGDWDGEGNIDGDPGFCDPASSNFDIVDTSPCVGAGLDGVDMGALGVGCVEPVAIESIVLPTEYILDQNYPNPFNPSTTIKYGLPEDSNVSLVIYDVRGQVVQALESGHQSAGWYDVVWNGQTADGKTISTGIYFVRLVAGDYSQVIKMLYLK